MRAFLFSDLHANYKNLAKLKDYLLSNDSIKTVISAGDFVNMGEPVGFIEELMKTLNEIPQSFFWVPGNNDFGRAYYRLQASHPSLEGKITRLDESILTGVGGSPASWAGQYAGENLVDKRQIAGSIFVSHVPPPGILNYQKIDFNSPAPLKKFSDSPLAHICGHIHTQYGVAYLGTTKVVKLAPLESGHYAIMDLKNLTVEFGRF